jgi:hypothetical protein
MRPTWTAVLIVAVMLTSALTPLAPRAAAQPADFPDLNSFSPVSAEQYFVTPPKENAAPTLDFSTPYNITCSFTRGNHYPQYLRCDGRMADSSDPCAFGEIYWEPSKSSYDRDWQGTNCGNPFSYSKLLSAGQKVSFLDVTCAVGDNRLVACLNTFGGQHGFVLRPSGSEFF